MAPNARCTPRDPAAKYPEYVSVTPVVLCSGLRRGAHRCDLTGTHGPVELLEWGGEDVGPRENGGDVTTVVYTKQARVPTGGSSGAVGSRVLDRAAPISSSTRPPPFSIPGLRAGQYWSREVRTLRVASRPESIPRFGPRRPRRPDLRESKTRHRRGGGPIGLWPLLRDICARW